MSEQGTYSYRDGEYRRDGEVIFVIEELCELAGKLAAAEDRCEQFKSTNDNNSESLLNEICKHTETMQRLTAAEACVAELTAWPSAQALIDKLAAAEACCRSACCTWKYDDSHNKHDTTCGHAFQFIDDGVIENGFKHCPWCGGNIQIDEEGNADE